MAPQTIGRYRVLRELGRGATGTVYLARDPGSGRQVAVKILLSAYTAAPDFSVRFEQALAALSGLDHPFLITPQDHGQDGEQYFVVTRYLPGGTLADRMDGRPMLLAEVVPILQRLAEALDSAHTAHILHGDLHPADILFDLRDRAFLSDLGLAQLLSAAAGPTAVSAAAYMSPEQIAGQPIDGRADVYALGILLFEMLTGRQPYSAGAPEELLRQHLEQPVPQLSSAALSHLVLPLEFNLVIARALAKNRDYRYPTAGVLAEAVRTTFLMPLADTADEPAAIPPAAPPPPAVPPAPPPSPPAAAAPPTPPADAVSSAPLPAVLPAAPPAPLPATPEPLPALPAAPNDVTPLATASAAAAAPAEPTADSGTTPATIPPSPPPPVGPEHAAPEPAEPGPAPTPPDVAATAPTEPPPAPPDEPPVTSELVREPEPALIPRRGPAPGTLLLGLAGILLVIVLLVLLRSPDLRAILIAPTATATPTLTMVPTSTPSDTATATASSTATATASPTLTPTATGTPSPTATASFTPVPSDTATVTRTPRPTLAPFTATPAPSAAPTQPGISATLGPPTASHLGPPPTAS